MADSITCIDDIIKLDIRKLKPIATSWGVSLQGCGDKKAIERRLIDHFIQNNAHQNGGDNSSVFMKAQLDQRKVSDKLLEKFKNANKLLQQFPDKLRGNLEKSYPNILQQFKEREESLRKGECWIIVAGEVGAGKSSAINLFLDCQLLPTDALKCTNTIIELRTSERKEAVCVLSNPLPGQSPIRTINLGELRGIQEFKDCATELDESDDNPFTRIEVYYPFTSLSEGVVIVDTPGIEGGCNVDARLQRYLNRAFGFIYVINTNTAGGVQQGRLGHLLKTVVNSCDDFNPETALFIGNKWENIPDSDKDDVEQDIFTKLSKVYPGVRHKQIHFMSVSMCREMAMDFRSQLHQHVVLLQKIGHLVPCCLRQGLTNHYWWLSAVFSRANYLLRVTNVQQEMSHEDLARKYQQMTELVARIERDSSEIIRDLRERVEFKVSKIISSTNTLLKARSFLEEACAWRESECPEIKSNWKMVVDDAMVKISTRLTAMIDTWERDERVLNVIDEQILNVFSRDFGLLENQIHEIESCLTSSRSRNALSRTIKVQPVRKLFMKKRKKIERTYNTLGGCVSCVGMLDTKRQEVRKAFREYGKNKEHAMKEATALYIQSILDNRDMGLKVRKFFDRFFKDIDEAANRLPVFLQADHQLIETLRKSLDGTTQLREQLPELSFQCDDQHGALDIFYVNEILNFDYDLKDLDWKGRTELGSGSFAVVYKTEIKQKKKPVAIKVFSDIVERKNIHDILQEDRIMRDLKHGNIVRYYGASYEKTPNGLRWIMVMELCNTNLRDYYLVEAQKANRVPGLIPSDHPRRKLTEKYVFEHCLDICRGLEHIHEKGYTHRDLKMENVLLTKEYVAKITDVGVAKATNLLVKTFNGSPAYMAPEVLLTSQMQTNKIDIYSISLIFWEMWYSRDVSDVMNREVLSHGVMDALGELKKRMGSKAGGWRPSFRAANPPPTELKEMIQRGWDDDPNVRPTASEFVEFFKRKLNDE